MSACLFLLDWADCCECECGPPHYSPSLLAHAIQRQLSLRHDGHAAWFWHPPPAAQEAADFCRWGIAPLESAPGPALLGELLTSHPEATHLVLGTRPLRALAALQGFSAPQLAIEVWSPRGLAAVGEFPVRCLRESLNLRTASAVGLFADWRLVAPALRGEVPAAAVRRMIQLAGIGGPVVTARTYALGAPDAVFECAGLVMPELPSEAIDAPEADERLRTDLLALLDDPAAPRSWVVVSEAPWLPGLIRRAHEHGIRLLVWPAREEGLPPSTRAEADGALELREVLAPLIAEGRARGRGIESSVRLSYHTGPRLERQQRPGPAEAPSTGGARLGSWSRLVFHAECILRQNTWNRIPFRKLAGLLAEFEEFGPTPANAHLWLSEARSRELLLVEQEPHRSEPGMRVVTCRPNLEHPVARAAIEVPERCLRLLCQMLQRMPWVSFKLLRSVLLREQWLGGPPYRLDETGVDEWLNFLIHDGAIRMSKEPNVANPEYPVTALRLNETHPIARTVATEAAQGARLAAERTILAVDHFLTRQRKPWMAMSALRRALDGMGRDELQEVLQGLQSLGALKTESYPNPQKEHHTTGCRLNCEDPIVVEALRLRDTIIRTAHGGQRTQPWVPLVQIDEEITASLGPAPSPAHRLAWFLLLRDEGILELDRDGVRPTDPWNTVSCRLNDTDAVVRLVVSGGAGPEGVSPS